MTTHLRDRILADARRGPHVTGPGALAGHACGCGRARTPGEASCLVCFGRAANAARRARYRARLLGAVPVPEGGDA